MARKRSTNRKSTTESNTTQQEEVKMAERGSLTKLAMVEVPMEELEAASGGRGHGAYDEFVTDFIAAKNDAGEPIRGTGVDFEGVAAQSVKTGLKGAINRAVESGKIEKDALQIRGKDGRVYLVRTTVEAAA